MAGFQHQKRYKIQSVCDGTYLDLHNATTATLTIIKTWSANGSAAQIWVADKEGAGFILETALNKKGTGATPQVVDLDVNKGKLTIYPHHGGNNQQFVTELVPTSCGKQTFLIKCVVNNRAIRHEGIGKQVSCVPANRNDICQLWTLQNS